MATKKNKFSEPHACPFCEADIAEAAYPYCEACGMKVTYCPKCGIAVAAARKNCPACGAELTGKTVKGG